MARPAKAEKFAKPKLPKQPKATKPVTTKEAKAPKMRVAVGKPKATEPQYGESPLADALTQGAAIKAAKENTTAFTLESDIAIPPRATSAGKAAYPFASMAVGQSFLVAVEKVDPDLYVDAAEVAAANREAKEKVSNRMSGAIRRFAKTHPHVKLTMRTVDEGIRIWRAAVE